MTTRKSPHKFSNSKRSREKVLAGKNPNKGCPHGCADKRNCVVCMRLEPPEAFGYKPGAAGMCGERDHGRMHRTPSVSLERDRRRIKCPDCGSPDPNVHTEECSYAHVNRTRNNTGRAVRIGALLTVVKHLMRIVGEELYGDDEALDTDTANFALKVINQALDNIEKTL